MKFSVNSRAGLLLKCLDSAASCIFTEKHSSCSLHSFIKKNEGLGERDGTHTHTHKRETISLFGHTLISFVRFLRHSLKRFVG